MSDVIHSWRFASSSGKNDYETLLKEDGSTSCNCRGWCMHVDEDGKRQCRHTRAVHAGRAEVECIPGTSLDMRAGMNVSKHVPIRQVGGSTKTSFNKTKTVSLEKVPARKISWK